MFFCALSKKKGELCVCSGAKFASFHRLNGQNGIYVSPTGRFAVAHGETSKKVQTVSTKKVHESEPFLANTNLPDEPKFNSKCTKN